MSHDTCEYKPLPACLPPITPQALREARVAFLEEEVPGMVARGAGLEAVKAKATALNVRLGPKMELMDSEVASTYEACKGLLGEGVDLSAAKTNAGSNLVAVME